MTKMIKTTKKRSKISEITRNNILEIAEIEFSDKGLTGARVDEIAEKTKTSKRMIYYHFGSKKELYKAVLEKSYNAIRKLELAIDIEAETPTEALRNICEITFDYHVQNPSFVRIIGQENILYGKNVLEFKSVRSRNRAIIRMLGRLIERGVEAGEFRTGIDPINLHMSISSLCFYYMSNKYTFSLIFAWDMDSPEAIAERKEIIVDTILRYCCL